MMTFAPVTGKITLPTNYTWTITPKPLAWPTEATGVATIRCLIKFRMSNSLTLYPWLHKKKDEEPAPIFVKGFTFANGWQNKYLTTFPVLHQEQAHATRFSATQMPDTEAILWSQKSIKLLRTPAIDLNYPALVPLKSDIQRHKERRPIGSQYFVNAILNTNTTTNSAMGNK
jgi:hypothetical protein